MYVYNITLRLDSQILAEWLNWMESQQLPKVKHGDLIEQIQVYKLLDQDETEGATYVMQTFIKTHTKYLEFIEKDGALLLHDMHQKWKNKFVIFSTSMVKVM